MTSDPSVEFSPRSLPAPELQQWTEDPEPLDPNWAPPAPELAWAPPPPPGPPNSDRPSPPRRRWRNLGPRSLTARLVTGVAVLVAALVLVTGACTYLALRSFLFDRLDQQVTNTASGNLAALFLPSVRQQSTGVQAPQIVWAVLVDSTGAVLAEPEAAGVQTMRLTADERRAVARQGGGTGPYTLRTSDGFELRVKTVGVPLTTGGEAVAAIGLSTAEVHRTLHRLVVLEWVVGASAVLIAFAATSWGVRFSLRRLYGVTRTAQEVASELSPEGAGLDRRVPVEDPSTEVGQLAESMNTLLSAVETQFAARLAHEEQMRQFLADASHELRTPLTSIRGYAELARMQRAHGEGDGGDLADNLGRIESEGTRMSRLVDDLLTLARSDQGAAPQRDVVDVADLLDEAVAGVRAAHPSRQIQLSAPASLSVIGDRDQLLRVVRNLVTNAAVHTRPDGPISVSAVHDGGWAVVRIADAGPGLPPEQAAHVFERFWRADKSRARARGGSGLGLSIVASIVHAHGGNVRFDSSIEAGSVVTVALPLDQPIATD